MSRRAFTVDEANGLIPRLESVFEALERKRCEAQESHDRAQVLELLWGDRLREIGNPDHAEGIMVRAALVASVREIERMIQEEIVERGLRFPAGGLERGLVDFPTTLDGRWVYLCWQRGEPTLHAWHEVGAGFSGRQPITSEHRLRMGREDEPGGVDDSALDF